MASAQPGVAWLLGEVDSGKCEVVHRNEEAEIKRKWWSYKWRCRDGQRIYCVEGEMY